MSNSKIEWTEKTWNPIRGSSLVSRGCTNCYAMKQAHRFSGLGKAYEGLTKLTKTGPVWAGNIRTVPELLSVPLKTTKPSMFFVNSMSDLFHDKVPLEFIAEIFNVMACATINCGKHHVHEEECWQGDPHIFQVLTKRPERMLKVLTKELPQYVSEYWSGDSAISVSMMTEWPLRNVWLGVSVEDQKTADERIPLLLQTPAAVRWISAEPLLNVVDIRWCSWCGAFGEHDCYESCADTPGIDWVVTGGESGPHARPSHPEWFRILRDQCTAAGIPFFFKQWGHWLPHSEWPLKKIGETTIPDCPHPRNEWMVLDSNGGLDIPDNSFPEEERSLYAVSPIGKKRAGRFLDGHIWNQYPESYL